MTANDTCVGQDSRGPVQVHRVPLLEHGGIPEDPQVKATPLFQVLHATMA